MDILAFIPARGGSKGIPRKNLTLLNGSPLIQYSIEAAQGSKYINNIFLSSDDPEIINFGKSFGLEVSYKRPAELAADETPMIDTILHGLEWWQKNKGAFPDAVLLLQPTSPLRSTVDIDGAIEFFVASKKDSLISVHTLSEHPLESIETTSDGWRYLSQVSPPPSRRQDYPNNFFFINGAIYLASTDFIFSRQTLIAENESVIFSISQRNGLDVDNELDLKKAEFYLAYSSRNSPV
jgi:CMP-N,N'-diacetyllegionaminic acid synthase